MQADPRVAQHRRTQDVAVIAGARWSLAFWSAPVLRRFAMLPALTLNLRCREREACDVASSVNQTSIDLTVCIDSTVAEKRPMRPILVNLVPIDIGRHNFLPIH